MLHSTNVKDGLESLAMVASLVPKADASGEIDVGEPIHITPLLLPECLQDHNYTTYNPEFSHPKMYMEVDKSLTAAHIPGNRLSYAPGVPQQHLTLQKMLKLSQKMKMQREAPEREKKILKKQKVSSGLQKIKKKEVVAEGSSEDENGDDGDDSNSRRRSARNLGRRKKYVDDIDVNLSDYEEAGDSDDERQKAYKKKKYGLKEEVEVDSDSEKPAKITLTQLRQGQQQTHSVTNYTDGLVQASVYYEPPEEEAQVVEKIMGHRTRPTKPEEKVYGEKIEEYLVKYKNFSYLHVEWGTFQKLIKGDKRFDQKLKRYKQKQEQLGPFADVDDEPFNPDYTVAERVLDMATQEEPNGEVVTHLLVKWKSLPYEDSTWELEEDIDRDKLERYLELQQTPSRSVMEVRLCVLTKSSLYR
jgi:chromodomain-helicase-DNA-binding protein 7